MRLTLDLTKAVLPDVRILWREGDEALIRQSNGESMVEGGVDLRVRHISRPPLQPVLANDDRTPFSRLNILRNEQNAGGEDARPNVQHHFIAEEFRLVKNEPRARVRRHAGVGKPPDHLVPDVVAHGFGRALPLFGGGGIPPRPECQPVLLRFPDQGLRMRHQLIELPVEPDSRIEVLPQVARRFAFGGRRP